MEFKRRGDLIAHQVDQADLAAAQHQETAMVSEAEASIPEVMPTQPQVDPEMSTVLSVEEAAREVALLRNIRNRRVAPNTGYIAFRRHSQ